MLENSRSAKSDSANESISQRRHLECPRSAHRFRTAGSALGGRNESPACRLSDGLRRPQASRAGKIRTPGWQTPIPYSSNPGLHEGRFGRREFHFLGAPLRPHRDSRSSSHSRPKPERSSETRTISTTGRRDAHGQIER